MNNCANVEPSCHVLSALLHTKEKVDVALQAPSTPVAVPCQLVLFMRFKVTVPNGASHPLKVTKRLSGIVRPEQHGLMPTDDELEMLTGPAPDDTGGVIDAAVDDAPALFADDAGVVEAETDAADTADATDVMDAEADDAGAAEARLADTLTADTDALLLADVEPADTEAEAADAGDAGDADEGLAAFDAADAEPADALASDGSADDTMDAETALAEIADASEADAADSELAETEDAETDDAERDDDELEDEELDELDSDDKERDGNDPAGMQHFSDTAIKGRPAYDPTRRPRYLPGPTGIAFGSQIQHGSRSRKSLIAFHC